MRLPREPFTVRRLMIAVAVVAILLGVSLHVRNVSLYSMRISHHSKCESSWREDEWRHRKRAEEIRKLAEDPGQRSGAEWWRQYAERETVRADKFKALADYHGQMKTKYQAAARRPWLPVEPDPLQPEL
jgi:hypothetical protein